MGFADEIRIITFDPLYAKAFADLNYEWIEQYFTVEDKDREMLDHPIGQIIDRGGEIFFALAGESAVGTAALVNDSAGRFELAKMAVSRDYRSRGIGEKLMIACVEYAKNHGAQSIFLLSNTMLAPAIGLYRKHGFVETVPCERSAYERVNIQMELALNPGKL